jgi:hypothetical protein
VETLADDRFASSSVSGPIAGIGLVGIAAYNIARDTGTLTVTASAASFLVNTVLIFTASGRPPRTSRSGPLPRGDPRRKNSALSSAIHDLSVLTMYG